MSEQGVAELGRFEFGKDGRVVLSRSDRPLTYYKRSWLTWTWVACLASDDQGCATLGRTQLSLDRAPPPLRDLPPPPPDETPPGKVPLTKAERERAQLEQVFRVADGVHHWWTNPLPPLFPPMPPPASPAPAAEKPPNGPAIPPFDIQQIPEVMEKLKLPVSAQMMRHWFAGEANYSANKDDVIAGIDQNGRPYPLSMIDQTIIKLDWVLGFPRAQAAHDELLSSAIFMPNAMAEIKKNLLAYTNCHADPFAPLNGMTASGGDIHRLHANFQFQRAGVDAKRLEKVIQWLAGDAGTIKVPDDLTGALGAFQSMPRSAMFTSTGLRGLPALSPSMFTCAIRIRSSTTSSLKLSTWGIGTRMASTSRHSLQSARAELGAGSALRWRISSEAFMRRARSCTPSRTRAFAIGEPSIFKAATSSSTPSPGISA